MVAVIRVAGGLVGILLTQRLPRRNHTRLSMAVMAGAMAALGGIRYLQAAPSNLVTSPALTTV